MMSQLHGEAHVLLSADSVKPNQVALYPTEYYNYISLTGFPRQRLFLRDFASIILLRSIDGLVAQVRNSKLSQVRIDLSTVVQVRIVFSTVVTFNFSIYFSRL